MSVSHGTISYGRVRIDFHVLFVPRKTLGIAVHPDGSVIVKAPVGTEYAEIERRVTRRARWIKRQLDYFDQFTPRTPPRLYIGGETHLYLGRQYSLKLMPGDENSVKLTRGFFLVTTQGPAAPESVKCLLEGWYSEKAGRQFVEAFDRCWSSFARLSLPQPRLAIRRMRTRWGSLSGKQTLTLNLDLVRAPKECIDYVVTHELCHLQYPDHNHAFYRLLEKILPDWQRRKHKLELALR